MALKRLVAVNALEKTIRSLGDRHGKTNYFLPYTFLYFLIFFTKNA